MIRMACPSSWSRGSTPPGLRRGKPRRSRPARDSWLCRNHPPGGPTRDDRGAAGWRARLPGRGKRGETDPLPRERTGTGEILDVLETTESGRARSPGDQFTTWPSGRSTTPTRPRPAPSHRCRLLGDAGSGPSVLPFDLLPEPGGVLFEIATDPPGFAIDKTPESLGPRSSYHPGWSDPAPTWSRFCRRFEPGSNAGGGDPASVLRETGSRRSLLRTVLDGANARSAARSNVPVRDPSHDASPSATPDGDVAVFTLRAVSAGGRPSTLGGRWGWSVAWACPPTRWGVDWSCDGDDLVELQGRTQDVFVRPVYRIVLHEPLLAFRFYGDLALPITQLYTHSTRFGRFRVLGGLRRSPGLTGRNSAEHLVAVRVEPGSQIAVGGISNSAHGSTRSSSS